MKYLFTITSLVSFWFLGGVAAEAYSQALTLEPGWNIVSTPRLVEGHTFSIPETSDNLSILTLDPSKASGWATMAGLGHSEFVPLFGYFVNNKTSNQITLTLTYKDVSTPAERIFTREFTTPGWYAIGVANPTHAKALGTPFVDNNTPATILESLENTASAYLALLDFGGLRTNQNKDSTKISSTWEMRLRSSALGDIAEINTIADLRENLGYAVYVASTSSIVGFQNTDIPQCADGVDNDGDGKTDMQDPGCTYAGMNGENSSSQSVSVKIYSGSAMPEEKVVFISDDNSGDKVTLNEFVLKAEGAGVDVDSVVVNVTPGNVSVDAAVSEFQLVHGTTVLATSTSPGSTTTASVVFSLDTPLHISSGESQVFKIVARMHTISTAVNTVSGFEQGDTLRVDFASCSASDENGDDVLTRSGFALGNTQTFRATGLNISKVSSTNTHYNNTNPEFSYAEFKMQIRVTASGDDIWVPLTSGTSTSEVGFSFEMKNSAGEGALGSITSSVSHISGGTRDGEYVKVADGESSTFEIVVTLDPDAANQYRMQLYSVGFTLAGATGNATAQILATPAQDFQSPLSYIQS